MTGAVNFAAGDEEDADLEEMLGDDQLNLAVMEGIEDADARATARRVNNLNNLEPEQLEQLRFAGGGKHGEDNGADPGEFVSAVHNDEDMEEQLERDYK
jgi:hypothetical protein